MIVDIAWFSYRNSPRTPTTSILVAREYLTARGHDAALLMLGNCYIHDSRNRAAAEHRPEAEYLIMVDDDMVIPPNAFERLLSHRAEVVTGVYSTREEPRRLLLYGWKDEAGKFVQVEDCRRDQPFTGAYAFGAGFCCISTETLAVLTDQYLSANDWLAHNAAMFDRMEIGSRRREVERARVEKLRRAAYSRDRSTARIFDFLTQPDETQGGEDICLGQKLRWAGVEVTVDPTISVGHLGEQVFWNHDYRPPQREAEAA